MNISKILNAERKKNKLSVEVVARESGIAIQTAYRFFQGRPIQSDTLEKLLVFFNAKITFK